MATHSSILAWEIRWTGEPGRFQSLGSQRVGNDLATEQHFINYKMYGYNLIKFIDLSCPSQCKIFKSILDFAQPDHYLPQSAKD